MSTESVRIPKEVYDIVKRMAEEHGITKSEAITLLVVRGLRKH